MHRYHQKLWEVCASRSEDFVVFVTPSLLSLVDVNKRQRRVRAER